MQVKRTENNFPAEDKYRENVLDHILDYFIHQQGHLLMKLQADRASEQVRNEIMALAKEQLSALKIDNREIASYLTAFERYIWGYYVLDELLSDPDISDIKCYDYAHIRIKRLGHRENAGIMFRSEEDYRRFVSMVAVKNEVNVSNINAIQHFTDRTSNPEFILRFNLCTGWVNTSNIPFLHIRKSPKKKKTMTQLLKCGFMTEEQKHYLQEKAVTATGIFFTGKGASGKTTLMNAMLDCIPEDKSGLVIQESDELSSEHVDMLFQHIREAKGEGRVHYGLKEMATNGLLIDLDYFIVGEIKGDEAAQFSVASFTGHICWATGHGRNEADGLTKLADYIGRATGDSFDKCLRVLTGLEVVVFMQDWQIRGISEIKGYDADKRQLILESVDLPLPLPREGGM